MERINFTYHDISDSYQLGLNTISTKAFQTHINEIIKFNNNVLLKLIFDDGYESIYLNVLPILKKTKIKAIVFPVTNYIGKYNDWDVNFFINRKSHLKKEQLIALSRNGWEIGSHSGNHYPLTNMNDQELYDHLKRSKNKLEDILNKKVVSLRPPFDKINQRVIDICENVGFENIYTSKKSNQYYYSNINLITTHPIYSIDTIKSIYKKLNNNYSENIKEKCIHFFSNLTIISKKYIFK